MLLTRLLVGCQLMVGLSCAKVEEIGDKRDLTFKIKTNDALVVGMFAKKGSKEEKLLRQVAQSMAPEGGIMFAVTYDAKIHKKYLTGDSGVPSEPPAVAVFYNFDPETGHSKKHVKGKAITADVSDYGSLLKFIATEALPLITRVPINLGPDAAKRNQISLRGGNPVKLFRFSTQSHALKDPEAKDADGAFLRGISKLRGKCTIVAVQISGGEHDEGLQYLEGMGYAMDDLDDGPKLVLTAMSDKEEYTGAADDDAAIAAWAEGFTTLHADAWNIGGKKKKKSKKKRKKGIDKSDL